MAKSARQRKRGPRKKPPGNLCNHRGQPVQVGPYQVLAGGCQYLQPQDLAKADVLIPLLDKLPPLEFGRQYTVLAAPLQDFGGVPANWEEFLRQQVIPLLEAGKKVLVFCMAGHGRTGTFLGSLIALLETPEQTPDPIAAVRERHCPKAVETITQAEAIFGLRGQPAPKKYRQEFSDKVLGWPRLAEPFRAEEV